jgi:hypothetical protein
MYSVLTYPSPRRARIRGSQGHIVGRGGDGRAQQRMVQRGSQKEVGGTALATCC